MFVRRKIPWQWTLAVTWPSLTYFLLVAVLVHLLRGQVYQTGLEIPFEPVVILGTALSIFLGFKNNEAYGRWWEARIIWGLAVNYSRAWGRQVLTLLRAPEHERAELQGFQRVMVLRHGAFIHALRVYLRRTKSYPQELPEDHLSARNDYVVCSSMLADEDYARMLAADNPPNMLLQLQGEDLARARERGWASEYVLVQLDQTLVELNNIQGRSERIKKTPMPRPYSYFQRVILHVHGTLLPFAFVTELGWPMIPISLAVSFVFLVLDIIGSRTEDPFENRVDDTPLSALSRTIERNLREQLGETELPPNIEPVGGVLM